ncbi:MAG TPA: hypothetical protein VMC85_08850 [Desulfomonilaceae bacterium]|nr:hypothetical protein [Desulfomonilaceae bacterium]
MNAKTPVIIFALLSLILVSAIGPAYADRTVYLSVCQELVNRARTYEARANYANQVAKSLMNQIGELSKYPKNQAVSSGLDNLFAQYDENRAMEQKFRELYRQAQDEAKQCMQSVQ